MGIYYRADGMSAKNKLDIMIVVCGAADPHHEPEMNHGRR